MPAGTPAESLILGYSFHGKLFVVASDFVNTAELFKEELTSILHFEHIS